MSHQTTQPNEPTANASNLQAQLREGLGRLRSPTRELLSSLKDATPELRQLALVTSPFAIRAELIAHGLAADQSEDGGDRCMLTPLGFAALDVSAPLSAHARQQLAAEADRALAISDSDARPADAAAWLPADVGAAHRA